jgi:hypothetical protein
MSSGRTWSSSRTDRMKELSSHRESCWQRNGRWRLALLAQLISNRELYHAVCQPASPNRREDHQGRLPTNDVRSVVMAALPGSALLSRWFGYRYLCILITIHSLKQSLGLSDLLSRYKHARGDHGSIFLVSDSHN